MDRTHIIDIDRGLFALNVGFEQITYEPHKNEDDNDDSRLGCVF